VNEGGAAHRRITGKYPIVVEFVQETIVRTRIVNDAITGREDVHVMTREAIDVLEQMGGVGVYRLVALDN
jgi:hypothetical protein